MQFLRYKLLCYKSHDWRLPHLEEEYKSQREVAQKTLLEAKQRMWEDFGRKIKVKHGWIILSIRGVEATKNCSIMF